LGGFVVGAALLVLLDPELRMVRNAAQDIFGYGGPHSDASEAGRDLFHSGVAIGGTKAGQTYSQFDADRDQAATSSFFGFGCIKPCAQHMAGYRWAGRHEIRRRSECIGLDWAFGEGCAAYVAPKYEVH
jgi:hypothetical protein